MSGKGLLVDISPVLIFLTAETNCNTMDHKSIARNRSGTILTQVLQISGLEQEDQLRTRRDNLTKLDGIS